MGDEDYGSKNNKSKVSYSFPMRVLRPRPISEGGQQIIDYPVNMTILESIVEN